MMMAMVPFCRGVGRGVALLALVICASTAYGAMNVYLNIEGVEGESKDADHGRWIDLVSFQHGVTQPGSGVSTSQVARVTGASRHKDLVVTKELDKASPKLAEMVCNGSHVGLVKLEVAAPGSPQKLFLRITMTDVIVTSVALGGGSADDRPTEEVSFNYGTITWSYIPYDDTGAPGEPVTTEWNMSPEV
jgi:type VI secretion system secreted protein Hcp